MPPGISLVLPRKPSDTGTSVLHPSELPATSSLQPLWKISPRCPRVDGFLIHAPVAGRVLYPSSVVLVLRPSEKRMNALSASPPSRLLILRFNNLRPAYLPPRGMFHFHFLLCLALFPFCRCSDLIKLSLPSQFSRDATPSAFNRVPKSLPRFL